MPIIEITGRQFSVSNEEIAAATTLKLSLVDLINESSSLSEAAWLAAAFKNHGIKKQDFESAAACRGIEKQLKDQLEADRSSVEATAATQLDSIVERAAEQAFHKLVAKLS